MIECSKYTADESKAPPRRSPSDVKYGMAALSGSIPLDQRKSTSQVDNFSKNPTWIKAATM